MATWFAASNITPADPNSLQEVVPFEGAYTDLVTGDKALVMILNVLTTYTYDSTSSETQSLPQVITPTGNAGNGRWILGDIATSGQNGFATPLGPQADTLATIGVAGTTFTLTHVADYDFFIDGVVYRKTGNETVEITDVEGLHVIYFDSEGTLQIQAPGGTLDDIILFNCIVAAVYWDGDAAILLFDERHGNSMSPATHYHLHETLGATYDEGLSLSNFSVDGTGATADGQFDIVGGTFHDEDNEINIPNDADARIDTFYRLGVGGVWKKATAAATFPVATGTVATCLDWNDYNGGTWQLLETTSNRFVLTHYFATNDVLSDSGIIGIMGQSTYITRNNARTGAETELASLLLGDLPVPEILPIATVIWQTNSGYANTIKAKVVSTDTGDDYIDWRTSPIVGSGSSTVDHESLAGLLGGAAADHYHLTGAQETDLTDGGDTDLHQHNALEISGAETAITATDGLIIRHSSSATPTLFFKDNSYVNQGKIVSGASYLSLSLYNGASFETAVNANLNGAVELYYNNVKAFETTAEGASIFDTSGTAPTLLLVDDAAETQASIYHDGTNMYIKNHIAGNIHMLDSDGNIMLDIDDGIGFRAYFTTYKVLTTSADGITVWGSDEEPTINMQNSSGNLRASIAINDADPQFDVIIKNLHLSGHVIIKGEDSASDENTMIDMDPDDDVQLYDKGLLSIATAANGMYVYDSNGTQSNVQFRGSAGEVLGRLHMSTTTVAAYSTDADDKVFLHNVDGSFEIYHNDLLVSETRSDGLGIYSSIDDNPIIVMYEDDKSTVAWKVESISGASVYMQSTRHGGDIWMSAENSGGTERWAGIDVSIPSFEPSPDDTIQLGASGARWEQLWAGTATIATSARDSKVLKGPTPGMQFIDRLDPQIYKRIEGNRDHWGLVAEDVKDAMDVEGVDFGCYIDPHFDGKPLKEFDQNGNPIIHYKGLRYSEFIAPMIKGMQEMHTMIKAGAVKIRNQKARIDQLEAEKILMQTQMQDIMVRLSALENPTESHSTKL